MTFWDFERRWQLVRDIQDRLAGRQGRLTGEAVFTRRDGGRDYVEAGQLVFGGQPALTAERRYRWEHMDGGARICFEDGRDFHVLRFGRAATARHHCPPDWYAVAYDFASWPAWSATWDVRGPRKDYRMVSCYALFPN